MWTKELAPVGTPRRRLVGILSYSGNEFGSAGHYVATVRRREPVSRPESTAPDANLVRVDADQLLRIDDNREAPQPVRWQQLVDDEAEWPITLFLYEASPSDYEDGDEEPLPAPSRQREHLLLEGAPAILREEILFRGDASVGRPTEKRLERDREFIRLILAGLIKCEGDASLFRMDPSFLLRGNDRSVGQMSVLHGQCQLGKTDVTLLLAWIAHFVYDTVPVIFVRSSGGA